MTRPKAIHWRLLPLFYLAVSFLLIPLRYVPRLNHCQPQGLFIFCLGMIDQALLLFNLPGVILSFIISRPLVFLTLGLNLPPVPFTILIFLSSLLFYIVLGYGLAALFRPKKK